MALPDKIARAFDSIGYSKRGENLYYNVPAMQRQIEAAADDPAALRKLLFDNITLSDAPPPAVSSYDAPAPAGRDPMSFENRATRDPNINEAVSELGMGADTPLPFKLDAYADSVAADGIENLIERMRFSAPQPEYSMDIANNRDILNQDITDLFPPTASGVSDVMPGAGMPSPGGGLITQGGPGVPIGGPTGSGVTVPSPTGLSTQVTPRTGLPGFGPRRLGTTAGVPQGAVDPRRATAADATTRPTPRLESPDVVGKRRAMNNLEDAVEAARGQDRAARAEAARLVDDIEMPPRAARGPDGQRPRIGPNARGAAQAAGIAALGAAAQLGMQRLVGPGGQGGLAPVPNITRPPRAFSTADLAAETSPPPQIMTQEPAPIRPREQAQELMRDLNLRRRAAGGEIPEAPAMMREIDRLMAMSNQTMAAASRGEVATGGNDPHMQAARLMAQRNEMLRRGMPTQQAQQMMAEITRLQRLGDEQRNARQAPRRAG